MSEPQRIPQVGDKRITVSEYRRLECEYCGEDATHRVTYLLARARSNPASSAYKRDDCSWCSDAARLVCAEHVNKAERDAPEGMGWCASFTGEKLPSMIHGWKQIESRVIPVEQAEEVERVVAAHGGSGS